MDKPTDAEREELIDVISSIEALNCEAVADAILTAGWRKVAAAKVQNSQIGRLDKVKQAALECGDLNAWKMASRIQHQLINPGPIRLQRRARVAEPFAVPPATSE